MSNEILPKAVEDAENQYCHVAHYSLVDKIHNKGGKDKRILIITNVFIAFYKVKRVLTRDRTMYWPYLTNITIVDNSFTISFGDEKFQFETKDKDLVLQSIVSIIQRILPLSLIQTFTIPQSCLNSNINPNSLGVVAKFLGICYKTGHQKLNNSFQLLRKYLSHHETIFNFSTSDLNQFIQPLIQCLSQVTFCESLILPKLDKSATTKLFLFLSETSLPYLKHILIKSQIPEDFRSHVTKLCQKADIALSGITFLDCQLNENDLTNIHQLIISKGMKSLALQNSLFTVKPNFLYKSFFTAELSSNLMMLNFDRTLKLDLVQLFECVPQLYSLSLANCELDIITVFQSLHTKPLENLMLLNLSNNKCTLSFDTIEFPKNLCRLDINDVTFDSTILSRFFSVFVTKKWAQGMKLSISKIKTDDNGWTKLYQCMHDLKSSTLTGLTWIGNDIDHDSFYHFLKQCKCLEYLDMSKTFTSQSYDAIHKFSEVLPQLPLLKTLILIGNEKNQMKSSIEPIILALEQNSMLRVLDIRNNLIGPNIFHYISTLIQHNSTLHTINLDGSVINNLDPYYELIKIVSNRSVPFYMSYPASDVDRLLESSMIEKKDKLGLITSLQKLSCFAMESNSKTPTSLDEPFEVYKLQNNSFTFPLYVDEELYNQFAYSNAFEEINSYFKRLSHDFSDRFSPSKVELQSPPSNDSVLATPLDKLRRIGQTTPQLKLKNIIDLKSPKVSKFEHGNSTDDLSDDDFDSVYGAQETQNLPKNEVIERTNTSPLLDLNSIKTDENTPESKRLSLLLRKSSVTSEIPMTSSTPDVFPDSDSDFDLPKSAQIAKPILHLPNQDELEKMQEDLDNDDDIFTGEFASLKVPIFQPQPVQEKKEPEKISLDQFQDDDDDDDIAGSNDSFFGPSIRQSFDGINELGSKLKIDLFHSPLPSSRKADEANSTENEKNLNSNDSSVVDLNEHIDSPPNISSLIDNNELDDSYNDKTINSEYDDSRISVNSESRIKSCPLIVSHEEKPLTPNKDLNLTGPNENDESSSEIEFLEDEIPTDKNLFGKIDKTIEKDTHNQSILLNTSNQDVNESIEKEKHDGSLQPEKTTTDDQIEIENDSVQNENDAKDEITIDHKNQSNKIAKENQIENHFQNDSDFIEEEESSSSGTVELYSRQLEEAKVLATAERLKRKGETNSNQINPSQISFVGTNDSVQAISNELYIFDGSKTKFEWDSESDKKSVDSSINDESVFKTPTKKETTIDGEKVSKIPKKNRTKEDEERLQKSYGGSENDFQKSKLAIQENTPEIKQSKIPISDKRVMSASKDKTQDQVEDKSEVKLKKFAAKKPDWTTFPLKPLSKPKDKPRVAKLDKKYSLQNLLNQVDAL